MDLLLFLQSLRAFLNHFQPYRSFHGYQGFRALGSSDADDDGAATSGGDARRAGVTAATQQAMMASQQIGGHVDPRVDQALAVAATVSAVLPPPADIVGEVATAVAALCIHLFAHKVSRHDALKLARKMHVPHAADVVGWTRRVIAASPQKRKRLLDHLTNQIKRKKKHAGKHGVGKALDALVHPGTAGRKTDREQLKLAVVRAVIHADKLSHQHVIGPKVEPPGLMPTEGLSIGSDLSGILPWVIGGALLLAVVKAASS